MKQGGGCEETWGREPSESPRGSLASADGIRAAWGGALAGPLGQSQLGGMAFLHSWLVCSSNSLSAVSLWASQFTLLSLSFLICKMGSKPASTIRVLCRFDRKKKKKPLALRALSFLNLLVACWPWARLSEAAAPPQVPRPSPPLPPLATPSHNPSPPPLPTPTPSPWPPPRRPSPRAPLRTAPLSPRAPFSPPPLPSTPLPRAPVPMLPSPCRPSPPPTQPLPPPPPPHATPSPCRPSSPPCPLPHVPLSPHTRPLSPPLHTRPQSLCRGPHHAPPTSPVSHSPSPRPPTRPLFLTFPPPPPPAPPSPERPLTVSRSVRPRTATNQEDCGCLATRSALPTACWA